MKVTCSVLKLADKSLTDHQPWELTKPIPLDAEGSSVESALGKSPDVHYIYVCIKVCSLMLLAKLMFLCRWIPFASGFIT